MRGLYLFVAGVVVGLVVHIAAAQNQNRGIIGVNHVGIAVPDLDEALTYYTETMGFPEAFRIVGDNGQPALVYVQVSRDTFIELQPANTNRPPGVSHFGIQVEDMGAVTTMFRGRGADPAEPRSSSTHAILSNITDPNGIRIELLELPPESLHAQASARWR
jgi:catechol 2,3-dioxygenase-like lactoylglutathione lyase family enzyme